MEKSAISGQNPHIGTGTKSGYWYPLCRGDLVSVPKIWIPVPIHSERLVPVLIKVIPVPMLPTTLFCILCTIKSCVHTPIVKEP